MKQLVSLVMCTALAAVLCGCQTTQRKVEIGECPLNVDVFSKPAGTYDGRAMVSINGKRVGMTYRSIDTKEEVWGFFPIKLMPGRYEVIATANGYEPCKEMVDILSKDHTAHLRLHLQPSKTPAQK